MSRYVSRALADRRSRAQQKAIAARIAICAVLLILSVTSAMVSYLFLRYTDQIAAHTHDTWQTIGSLGALAAFVSFCSLLFVPLVAAGLHE